MSQWTHVAGIIRIDSMGAAIVRGPDKEKNNKIKEAVAKALGNTFNFESSEEDWNRGSAPAGSEGSLQYSVSSNSDGDEHALSWGYISIWGDLRDFGSEDVPSLTDWFQKSLERLLKPEGFEDPAFMSNNDKAEYMLSSFMIRDAVLGIHVEYSPRIVLVWDDEKKKVNMIQ
ncbi:hypothetical protein LCGC14_2676090 [marine sediment metagenome]|uniref:Uncharacterized protein n=1 Tax=marine sediment metagenome TaxID=412755 RepID=A0A0F9AA87_9ZZZZ